MNQYGRTARALIIAMATSTGCAHQSAIRRPATASDVEADLAALRALGLFEVGHLIVDRAPLGSHGCASGQACPELENFNADEFARQAARLHALTKIALDDQQKPWSGLSKEEAKGDSQKLRDLRIFTFEEIVFRFPGTGERKRGLLHRLAMDTAGL